MGLALIPGSFVGARYIPSGGYIDSMVFSFTSSQTSVFVWSLIPVAAIALLTGPYLVAFIKKARSN